MTAAPHFPVVVKPSLEAALEDAVVLSWNELMSTSINGVVNVEYHTGPGHLLEYLKVWGSRERGYWSLICEYWKCSLWSHLPGISLEKGYQPGNFSRRLEDLMQREDTFNKSQLRNGSVRIYSPTENERTAAESRTETLIG